MTTKTKLAASVALIASPVADVATILKLADTADAKGTALVAARHAFTDYAVGIGMLPEYFTKPKDGSNDPLHATLYRAFKEAAVRNVAKETGNGRKVKLSADNVVKMLDPTVQAKVILQGFQKAGATAKGAPASWNASVTSKMSDWRDWLNKALAEGQTKEETARKDDKAYIVAKLGDVLKRMETRAKKEEPDTSMPNEVAAAFTKDLLKLVDAYKMK